MAKKNDDGKWEYERITIYFPVKDEKAMFAYKVLEAFKKTSSKLVINLLHTLIQKYNITNEDDLTIARRNYILQDLLSNNNCYSDNLTFLQMLLSASKPQEQAPTDKRVVVEEPQVIENQPKKSTKFAKKNVADKKEVQDEAESVELDIIDSEVSDMEFEDYDEDVSTNNVLESLEMLGCF